jgi:hypothetical protein
MGLLWPKQEIGELPYFILKIQGLVLVDTQQVFTEFIWILSAGLP